MKKISDLNTNINNRILLYKTIINSTICDDEDAVEFKELCKKVIDSYLLVVILKRNKRIKNFSSKYTLLKNSLSIDVNKYSKIQKLLRKRKYYSNIQLLSDNDKAITNLEDINTIYLKDNTSSEINPFLENGIFNYFSSSNLSSDNYKFNAQMINIDSRIKKIFIRFNVAYLNEMEYSSINNIILKSKKMYNLYFLLKSYEEIKNINSDDYNVSDNNKILLKELINESSLKYENVLVSLNSIIFELNNLIDDYVTKYYYYIGNDINLSEDLKDKYKRIYSMYLTDDTFKFSFYSYLCKYYSDENELLDYEYYRKEQFIDLYSDYLIYKIPLNEDLSFDDFLEKKYGIKINNSTKIKK